MVRKAREFYEGLTIQAGADEAERWLGNFIPSLEYLEENADLSEPKREYLARLISALMEARANALLVRAECVRERSYEALMDAEPFVSTASQAFLRNVILSWVEQGRIRVLGGVLCVRMNQMSGRKLKESYRPLNQRMLDTYTLLQRQGLISPIRDL